jgi:hypothetical protein
MKEKLTIFSHFDEHECLPFNNDENKVDQIYWNDSGIEADFFALKSYTPFVNIRKI